MKQVMLNLHTGEVYIEEVPCPPVKKGFLLVESRLSLLSAGTERALLRFSRAGYIQKAREQPEKVRQVMDKVKTDGLLATAQAVWTRLDQPQPMGYCNVGVVVEAGEGLEDFHPGDRVVSNGAHAEFVCIPRHLSARIPPEVSDEDASFAVVSSIALQGVRLLQPTLGENVVVIGLGLIGLIAVQILHAHGARVLGIDLDPRRVEHARRFGVETVLLGDEDDPETACLAFSHGHGVDGVLVAAATTSAAPLEQAARICRPRGRIVLTGVTGMELNRDEFYRKELSFRVSCSYGPGRYDPAYEEQGHDYPIGLVRWTSQRNFQAVLELMRQGKLRFDGLIGDRLPVENAADAYRQVADSQLVTAVLTYAPPVESRRRTLPLPTPASLPLAPAAPQPLRLAVIGAGNFTRAVLLPLLARQDVVLDTIASAGGLSSAALARKYRFQKNSNDLSAIFSDPAISTVFLTTRHDSHARLVMDALNAGKHVFVEKPLCLHETELEQILETLNSLHASKRAPILMVGFNRRFAPLVERVKTLLQGRRSPLTAILTVNAGAIPRGHWTQDPQRGGGRILGEACHFIDLLAFLAGRAIQSVAATSLCDPSGADPGEDKMTITLTMADGSHGTVHYFANGHRSFPKERVEIFCEGRILQIDNFRRLRGYGVSSRRRLFSRQDKGHAAECAAFLRAVREGGPSPIPLDDLVNTTRATFAAVQSARDQGSVVRL